MSGGTIPIEGLLLCGVAPGAVRDCVQQFSARLRLRGKGSALDERRSSTLEVESGSNDPMAIFLTVELLELIVGGMEPGWPLLGMFLLQAAVGGLGGLLVGRLGVEAINRIKLDAAGLHLILMGSVSREAAEWVGLQILTTE